tara:strand:- start:12275 stop:13042 length:768 start_codon:yes stop_codon:yes gene_type:complete
MGLSIKKGNGGYIGLDKRNYSSNLTSAGNFSIRRHYLTRLSGELGPTVPNVLFEDDFEDGTLDKWTVLNTGQANFWIVGETPFNPLPPTENGTKLAYITNDGVNNTYNSESQNTNSHMFFDFTIPPNASSLTLTFDWSCRGENGGGPGDYDYGYIMIVTPQSFTPIAGTEYDFNSEFINRLETNINNGKFNGDGGSPRNQLASTSFVSEIITIDSRYGQWCTNCNRRMVFSWTDDTSVERNPPWAINNVKLIYNS